MVSVAAINGASAGEPVSVVEFYTITVSREDVSSAIIINLDPNSEYCQLVQYREWAMSVLPWLYPLSHHAGKHNYYACIVNLSLNTFFHRNGGSDCWGYCRTDSCRDSTNHSLHCLHVSSVINISLSKPNY